MGGLRGREGATVEEEEEGTAQEEGKPNIAASHAWEEAVWERSKVGGQGRASSEGGVEAEGACSTPRQNRTLGQRLRYRSGCDGR